MFNVIAFGYDTDQSFDQWRRVGFWSMLQLIHIPCWFLINKFLHHFPYHVIHGIEIVTVGRPQVCRDELWTLMSQQLRGLMHAQQRRAILLQSVNYLAVWRTAGSKCLSWFPFLNFTNSIYRQWKLIYVSTRQKLSKRTQFDRGIYKTKGQTFILLGVVVSMCGDT